MNTDGYIGHHINNHYYSLSFSNVINDSNVMCLLYGLNNKRGYCK